MICCFFRIPNLFLIIKFNRNLLIEKAVVEEAVLDETAVDTFVDECTFEDIFVKITVFCDAVVEKAFADIVFFAEYISEEGVFDGAILGGNVVYNKCFIL